MMVLTITITVVAKIALATLEVWVFWRLGERDSRRRGDQRAAIKSAGGGAIYPGAVGVVVTPGTPPTGRARADPRS